jgi:hypothetical protein
VRRWLACARVQPATGRDRAAGVCVDFCVAKHLKSTTVDKKGRWEWDGTGPHWPTRGGGGRMCLCACFGGGGGSGIGGNKLSAVLSPRVVCCQARGHPCVSTCIHLEALWLQVTRLLAQRAQCAHRDWEAPESGCQMTVDHDEVGSKLVENHRCR